MATGCAPAEKAADLLQKLSLDPQAKTENSQSTKPIVDSGNVPNGQIQSSDRSLTPLLPDPMDPTMWYANGYAPYYYGGYDGTGNGWDDYSNYLKPDGVDMSHGVYGGYGYAPYGAYSPAGTPVPTLGHDGQLYAAQQYQYPASYFQPAAAPAKGDISTAAPADQPILSIETPKGKPNGIANSGGVKGNKGSTALKPTYQNSSYISSSYNANSSNGTGVFPGGVPASGYVYDASRSSVPWFDGSVYSNGKTGPLSSTSFNQYTSNGNGVPVSKNQNARPHHQFTGYNNRRPLSGLNSGNGYVNRMYSNKFYNQNGISYRSGFYGSNGYDSRTMGSGWFSVDNKYKPRGRGNGCANYGNGNVDGLNELNRGPRAKSFKNQKGAVPASVAVKGQDNLVTGTNGSTEDSRVDKENGQYNRADFPITYADAKFFIIKSYSEDDVHKSVKYNVWSSTQNGNKKLDAAYHEAQQNSGHCPVFLLFSVNTSGQFVGVAEMSGPVDFDKILEYWQQDKWVGCFPVKWHIVKDVPNSLLKHITLENNENKPVTNSRDTQEVKLEQGLQLLKIFQDYTSAQSVLDDFDFYEDRQKKIQDRKAKQQLIQKQLSEGKPTDESAKEGSNVEVTTEKSVDVPSNLTKNATRAVFAKGDANVLENVATVEAQEVSKPVTVTAKELVSNGVANGC
ncbi:hypothetical protein DCAR_0727328 [Daucus carota subsp. sativus]|uniref:YTH domain-containing family protein n=1 Tax=Daucus carota subsp. sativus TaxID=79200 RepID=A0A161WQR2_DAUCS|nr:PREDICTED: uncharacterized protein LOC108196126 [Daucus carota subsp. sativus]WOH07894.1 hypothetical protein DCAR_0727328 [Daucus carota subsp. sativus]